jgi:hypothetical protein
MTLQEQIDGLPEWPELPIVYATNAEPYKSNTLIRHLMSGHTAATARLALAKGVIADRVQIRDHDDWLAICALLKALEPK